MLGWPSPAGCTSKLADSPEGDLWRARANLVKEGSLYQLALGLGLPELLRLGEGEARSGGKRRPSILADAVEAILGAVYLEAGFPVAEQVVHQLFAKVDITPQMQAVGKDPKTALQEWLQGRRMALPQYDVEKISGAAHKQTFTVACMIPALRLGAKGQGLQPPHRRTSGRCGHVKTLAGKASLMNSKKQATPADQSKGLETKTTKKQDSIKRKQLLI